MITLYGTSWCPDCLRVKKLLGDYRVEFVYIDIQAQPEARAEIEKRITGDVRYPILILADNSMLVEPRDDELIERLHLQSAQRTPCHDVIIVGGGPAGLTAAIYTSREGIDTVLIEKGVFGGQAATTWTIDNYPGFPESISGLDFAERLRKQVETYGTHLMPLREVASLQQDGSYRMVTMSDGEVLRTRTVLLAPGARYRTLTLPHGDTFIGRGIHYCATCDGAFYRDRDIIVLGGGNSAAEESIFLTRFARHITMLVRSPTLQAEEIIIKKLQSEPKISIVYNTTVHAVLEQDGKFAGVSAINAVSGQIQEYAADGIFVFIGMQPSTDFIADVLDRDAQGYIQTDAMLQTSMRGVFAAGDARAGSTKQIATAVGEGATAALMIREYLKNY